MSNPSKADQKSAPWTPSKYQPPSGDNRTRPSECSDRYWQRPRDRDRPWPRSNRDYESGRDRYQNRPRQYHASPYASINRHIQHVLRDESNGNEESDATLAYQRRPADGLRYEQSDAHSSVRFTDAAHHSQGLRASMGNGSIPKASEHRNRENRQESAKENSTIAKYITEQLKNKLWVFNLPPAVNQPVMYTHNSLIDKLIADEAIRMLSNAASSNEATSLNEPCDDIESTSSTAPSASNDTSTPTATDTPRAVSKATVAADSALLQKSAEQVTRKLINQLTTMSKYNLKQMIDNPAGKYETALNKHAQNKLRAEVRKQLKSFSLVDAVRASERLSPDEAIDAEKIPEALLEQIGHALDLDFYDLAGSCSNDLTKVQRTSSVLNEENAQPSQLDAQSTNHHYVGTSSGIPTSTAGIPIVTVSDRQVTTDTDQAAVSGPLPAAVLNNAALCRKVNSPHKVKFKVKNMPALKQPTTITVHDDLDKLGCNRSAGRPATASINLAPVSKKRPLPAAPNINPTPKIGSFLPIGSGNDVNHRLDPTPFHWNEQRQSLTTLERLQSTPGRIENAKPAVRRNSTVNVDVIRTYGKRPPARKDNTYGLVKLTSNMDASGHPIATASLEMNYKRGFLTAVCNPTANEVGSFKRADTVEEPKAIAGQQQTTRKDDQAGMNTPHPSNGGAASQRTATTALETVHAVPLKPRIVIKKTALRRITKKRAIATNVNSCLLGLTYNKEVSGQPTASTGLASAYQQGLLPVTRNPIANEMDPCPNWRRGIVDEHVPIIGQQQPTENPLIHFENPRIRRNGKKQAIANGVKHCLGTSNLDASGGPAATSSLEMILPEARNPITNEIGTFPAVDMIDNVNRTAGHKQYLVSSGNSGTGQPSGITDRETIHEPSLATGIQIAKPAQRRISTVDRHVNKSFGTKPSLVGFTPSKDASEQPNAPTSLGAIHKQGLLTAAGNPTTNKTSVAMLDNVNRIPSQQQTISKQGHGDSNKLVSNSSATRQPSATTDREAVHEPSLATGSQIAKPAQRRISTVNMDRNKSFGTKPSLDGFTSSKDAPERPNATASLGAADKQGPQPEASNLTIKLIGTLRRVSIDVDELNTTAGQEQTTHKYGHDDSNKLVSNSSATKQPSATIGRETVHEPSLAARIQIAKPANRCMSTVDVSINKTSSTKHPVANDAYHKSLGLTSKKDASAQPNATTSLPAVDKPVLLPAASNLTTNEIGTFRWVGTADELSTASLQAQQARKDVQDALCNLVPSSQGQPTGTTNPEAIPEHPNSVGACVQRATFGNFLRVSTVDELNKRVGNANAEKSTTNSKMPAGGRGEGTSQADSSNVIEPTVSVNNVFVASDQAGTSGTQSSAWLDCQSTVPRLILTSGENSVTSLPRTYAKGKAQSPPVTMGGMGFNGSAHQLNQPSSIVTVSSIPSNVTSSSSYLEEISPILPALREGGPLEFSWFHGLIEGCSFVDGPAWKKPRRVRKRSQNTTNEQGTTAATETVEQPEHRDQQNGLGGSTRDTRDEGDSSSNGTPQCIDVSPGKTTERESTSTASKSFDTNAECDLRASLPTPVPAPCNPAPMEDDRTEKPNNARKSRWSSYPPIDRTDHGQKPNDQGNNATSGESSETRRCNSPQVEARVADVHEEADSTNREEENNMAPNVQNAHDEVAQLRICNVRTLVEAPLEQLDSTSEDMVAKHSVEDRIPSPGSTEHRSPSNAQTLTGDSNYSTSNDDGLVDDNASVQERHPNAPVMILPDLMPSVQQPHGIILDRMQSIDSQTMELFKRKMDIDAEIMRLNAVRMEIDQQIVKLQNDRDEQMDSLRFSLFVQKVPHPVALCNNAGQTDAPSIVPQLLDGHQEQQSLPVNDGPHPDTRDENSVVDSPSVVANQQGAGLNQNGQQQPGINQERTIRRITMISNNSEVMRIFRRRRLLSDRSTDDNPPADDGGAPNDFPMV